MQKPWLPRYHVSLWSQWCVITPFAWLKHKVKWRISFYRRMIDLFLTTFKMRRIVNCQSVAYAPKQRMIFINNPEKEKIHTILRLMKISKWNRVFLSLNEWQKSSWNWHLIANIKRVSLQYKKEKKRKTRKRSIPCIENESKGGVNVVFNENRFRNQNKKIT